MASLERLKSGKWRVAWHVTVRHGEAAGKIHRSSATFTDKAVARDFLRTVEDQEDRWRAGMASPTVTWSTLVKEFFKANIGLGKRTKEFYRAVLDKFYRHRNNAETIGDISGPIVRRFLDTLPSEATRNNHLSPLRSLFLFAVGRGWLADDPTALIAFARSRPKLRPPPTPAEIGRLVRAAQPWFRPRILLLAYTGLRITEALTLNKANWINDRLVVQGKGIKTRSIPLHPVARLALKKIGFPVYDGNPQFGRRNWGNIIRKACEDAKLAGFGPHMLRHWFASQLAGAGVDMGRIARVLGHSDVKLTYSVYVHYADDHPPQTARNRRWRSVFGS